MRSNVRKHKSKDQRTQLCIIELPVMGVKSNLLLVLDTNALFVKTLIIVRNVKLQLNIHIHFWRLKMKVSIQLLLLWFCQRNNQFKREDMVKEEMDKVSKEDWIRWFRKSCKGSCHKNKKKLRFQKLKPQKLKFQKLKSSMLLQLLRFQSQLLFLNSSFQSLLRFQNQLKCQSQLKFKWKWKKNQRK